MRLSDISMTVSLERDTTNPPPTVGVSTFDNRNTRIRDDGIDILRCRRGMTVDRIASVTTAISHELIDLEVNANVISALHNGIDNGVTYRHLLHQCDIFRNLSLDAGTRVQCIHCVSDFDSGARSIDSTISRVTANVERNFDFSDLDTNSSDDILSHARLNALRVAQNLYHVKTGHSHLNAYNAEKPQETNGAVLVNIANQLLGFAVQHYADREGIPLIYENMGNGNLWVSEKHMPPPMYAQIHSPLRLWWHLVNQMQLDPQIRLEKGELIALVLCNHKRMRH